jgi:hypothetical protein
MNDAAQIRRRSGALRASHFRFRSSSVQLTPAPRPHLKISNREPRRLEIPSTHTKQTLHQRSNRENNACFSTGKMGRLPVREDRPPQDPHHLRSKAAKKTNSPPTTFVSARKKSALCFVQVTEFPIEPMFRLERTAERTNLECRAESSRGDAHGGRRVRSKSWLKGKPAPTGGKVGGRGGKIEIGAPKSVSVRTEPDRLFCSTYRRF